MDKFTVLQQQKLPSLSLLSSSLSDFNGNGLHTQVQYKTKILRPKRALNVTASSTKKILIMGGTRFIGKMPIAQQLPGESDQDFADFSAKIGRTLNLSKSSLSDEGFAVVYDINGREADEVEPITDALPNLEQQVLSRTLLKIGKLRFLKNIFRYIYCSSAGVYLKFDLLPHFETDAVDPKSWRQRACWNRRVFWTSIIPVYIHGPLMILGN